MELLIMSSGFTVGTQDLDDIFEPRIEDDPVHGSSLGYITDGQTLSDRYYPLSEGGEQAAATGYHVGSDDLNQIFAAIGTVSREIDTGIGSNYFVSAVNFPNTGTTTTSANLSVNIQSTGKFYIWGGGSPTGSIQGGSTDGTWLPSGDNVSDYEFLLDYSVTSSYSDVFSTNLSSTEWRKADQTNRTFQIGISMEGQGTASAEAQCVLSIRKVGSSNATEQNISLRLNLDLT